MVPSQVAVKKAGSMFTLKIAPVYFSVFNNLAMVTIFHQKDWQHDS